MYTVRPLFFAHPVERHPRLERALLLLARELRNVLHREGKNWRHDDLALYSFYPELQFERLEVAVELCKKVHRGRFLFVTFPALESAVTSSATASRRIG